MELTLLHDIIVIFGLAVLVLLVCHRLRIPSIVGFLLTGIMAGPHGIALVSSVEQVEVMAEFGVIILLFSIGLEFSFKSLLSIKRTIFLGGSLQVGLTILLTFIISRVLGMPVNHAIFLGFLVSLSSTAIVLKQLGERLELSAPHGRTALGILIYQDIIVVVMMLFTPLLAAGTPDLVFFGWVLLKAAGMIALIFILSEYVIPPALYHVTRTQSRELFLLSIIVICFSVAWLTSIAGLSLALGAFLAGLIIAESEYSHEALGNIMPFIDTFTSLFFVSIGMLLNIQVAVDNIGLLLLFTLGILAVKGLVASLASIILGYPLRIAILVGFSLCQIGEFSFILSQTGVDSGLLGGGLYQGFLAASILTMMVTPFLIAFAPRAAALVEKIPLPERFRSGRYSWEAIDEDIEQKDQLIIIGYGLNGKNLSRAAAKTGIPYIILEMNSETVRREKELGEPIYYGDATNEMVLKQIKVYDARVVVIAISDSAATKRITSMVRKLNPEIHTIVRTRFVADVQDLYELGANEVIPEEYETSVEIFARVLDRYMVPRDEIEDYVHRVRMENYEMLRSLPGNALQMDELKASLSNMEIGNLMIKPGYLLEGKSLAEIDLRSRCGAMVLAIKREGEIEPNPSGENTIHAGDNLVLLGTPDELRKAVRLLAEG